MEATKWRLGACPKCKGGNGRGDLYREDNSWQCVQCGYIIPDKKTEVKDVNKGILASVRE
jgi:Zn ribbon nucleic-acid-binding protein